MAAKEKGKATAKAVAPRKQAPAAAPVVEEQAPAAVAPVAEVAPVVEGEAATVSASVAYAAPVVAIEAAPAAGAPESPSAEAVVVVTHLQVSARKEGFRRAGRAWTVAETRVAIDEFAADQVEQLLAEPKLVVLPVSDVAGQ